jgi:L-asparaginase
VLPVVLVIVLASIAPAAPHATPAAEAPRARQAVAATPAPPRAAQPRQARPRVHLVATGGTISNRTGGRLTAAELVASVPRLSDHVDADAEQFANVASSELTLQDFLRLSRRINALYRIDASLAGVVVTSGTDTLEELAYFLHLTVRDPRPVVVVGSMRNPSTLGYEGAANLLAGFRVAADPASRGMGALIVLNDEINSAREGTKTDALRLHTFESRGPGLLGVVDADRVVYYRKPVRRRGADSEFDVQRLEQLPRVDIVLVYQDAPGDLIRAAVDAGARGIVIATAGAGATSGTQADGLAYAAGRGVVVVYATRAGSGRIAERRQSGRPLSIAADDLAPVKARVLLMLGLAQTSDPDDLQRLFREY